MEKDEKTLIDEALKVYKIPRKYLFNSGIDKDTGEVMLYSRWKKAQA